MKRLQFLPRQLYRQFAFLMGFFLFTHKKALPTPKHFFRSSLVFFPLSLSFYGFIKKEFKYHFVVYVHGLVQSNHSLILEYLHHPKGKVDPS